MGDGGLLSPLSSLYFASSPKCVLAVRHILSEPLRIKYIIPSIANTIPIVASDCSKSKLTQTTELSELSTATFAAASPAFLIFGSRRAAK